MNKDSRIFVAGHRGLVGSAIVRKLGRGGYDNIILRERSELDLRRQSHVEQFFDEQRPEYVFLAAAKVGGILANQTNPADFIRDNLAVQLNVIDAAWRSGARKLQFLGSSCIYPRLAPQPIKEEYLLTGALESTNESYAIAKIAGIRMAQAYRAQYGFHAISLMPTNLYGPGDNFDLSSSHVLPALVRRLHEAKLSGAHEVLIWGTGQPRREFLHVDDLADAAIHFMVNYDDAEIVNVGTGTDLTIRELAEVISKIVGFQGRLVFDSSKPDGTPQKLLDVSRAHGLGWSARIPLREGIRQTYRWFIESNDVTNGKKEQANSARAADIPRQE
jgi:GDP-L-fucose synthase